MSSLNGEFTAQDAVHNPQGFFTFLFQAMILCKMLRMISSPLERTELFWQGLGSRFSVQTQRESCCASLLAFSLPENLFGALWLTFAYSNQVVFQSLFRYKYSIQTGDTWIQPDSQPTKNFSSLDQGFHLGHVVST